VPIYLVERNVPGLTMAQLRVLCRSAALQCESFTAESRTVRYLRSTFAPGESRCFCLFEAPSADLIQEVNDAAQAPFSRIVIAVELPLNHSFDVSDRVTRSHSCDRQKEV
jgi:Protein of unknown function (DUF4242)